MLSREVVIGTIIPEVQEKIKTHSIVVELPNDTEALRFSLPKTVLENEQIRLDIEGQIVEYPITVELKEEIQTLSKQEETEIYGFGLRLESNGSVLFRVTGATDSEGMFYGREKLGELPKELTKEWQRRVAAYEEEMMKERPRAGGCA